MAGHMWDRGCLSSACQRSYGLEIIRSTSEQERGDSKCGLGSILSVVFSCKS